jgi:hypothetical protein
MFSITYKDGYGWYYYLRCESHEVMQVTVLNLLKHPRCIVSVGTEVSG